MVPTAMARPRQSLAPNLSESQTTMLDMIRRFGPLGRKVAPLLGITGLTGLLTASDHADVSFFFPGLVQVGRLDANIIEFFAFRASAPWPEDDKLVLIAALEARTSDPERYFFAEDLTLRFHIDNHSEVTVGDGDPNETADDWMMRFGGTVTDVDHINNDILIEVTFEPTSDGRTAPRLRVDGLPKRFESAIRVFPEFSESPVRSGNAVVALELPLELALRQDHDEPPADSTLLLWVTTNVPEIEGPLSDHMGMPNTSNQLGNAVVNRLRPRDQWPFITRLPRDLIDLPGLPVSVSPYADVLIYHLEQDPQFFPTDLPFPIDPPPFDPFNPARFPNGHPVNVRLRSDPFVFPYIKP